MTWVKFDDRWVESPVLEQLSHPARWHYLTLIFYACRTERYETPVTESFARRSSDVPDPAAALRELEAVHLIRIEKGQVILTKIREHALPPHLRDEQRKAASRQRKAKSRARQQAAPAEPGSPSTAEGAEAVTRDIPRDITRDPGSGRAGSERRPTTQRERQAESPQGWPTLELCEVCTQPVPPGRGVHEGCAAA